MTNLKKQNKPQHCPKLGIHEQSLKENEQGTLDFQKTTNI